MPTVFYQITLTLPGNISSRVFDFLTDSDLNGLIPLSASATRTGDPDTSDWRLIWLFDSKPEITTLIDTLTTQADMQNISDLPALDPVLFTCTDLPDCNWLERSYQGFQPFTIGRFHFRGRHDEKSPVPPEFIGILIDAVTAFGSGEHPTTRGCLLHMDHLALTGKNPTRILDLGTGSGILAIAAHKLWPDAQITAVDNDPESVRVAAEYARYNDVPAGTGIGQMHTILADTPTQPAVKDHGPFDLILANILAGPLVELAPALAQTLAPHGDLILSGLLEKQIADVMTAYIPLGFSLQQAKIIGDWAALVLNR